METPWITLFQMESEPLLLALDFGGTKLTAGLAVAGQHHWQARRQAFSPPDADATYDFETMISLARSLLSDVEGKPAAVGVSFGGPVNAAEGIVLLSHHVPGWENTPLRDQLESSLGVPVSIDNDANAGALGEWRLGAGRDCQSLLYITVSTGIGGGWVLGGKVYHGADSVAGEIGHITVEHGGPACICGRRGCLEAVAAGPAIARRAQERLRAESQTGALLRQLAGGAIETVTAKHVSQAAQAGDELARQVLDETARALGFGISYAISLMNPERVVVGGGVAKSGPRY
ncbi:MAG: ROK family protein, partial [Anaerolineae bacterium]